MDAADLEQALREHPDDLATWLVYGDWLLEQGDARGALIQLEQRRARARPADRAALDAERDALVKRHQAEWDAALPAGVTVVTRRHGFATAVAVEWNDAAPALIEQALRERFVTALRIAPPDDDGLDSEDYEEGDFDEHGNPKPLPPLEAGALAELDPSRLVELDLSYVNLGAPGAKALAASLGRRAKLAAIDLRYCNIGNRGLAALAACPGLGGLRRLHLQRNGLTAAGVASLQRLGALVELDLRYNKIGAAGAQALLEAPFIGSLARLHLYRTDVSGAGVKKLARAAQLPPALRSYWRSV